MSFRTLLAQTATVIRATSDSFDAYGNPETTWETIAEGIPCRIHENSSTETLGDRESIERTALCFLEADTDVTAYDRLEINGETWEVDGAPVTRVGLAAAHHIEANLRQVTP